MWLGLMVVFLIIELATVGLTSIWFSGGALAALLVSLAGAWNGDTDCCIRSYF